MAQRLMRNTVAILEPFTEIFDEALRFRELTVVRSTDLDVILPADSFAVDPALRSLLLCSAVDELSRTRLTRALRRARKHLDLGLNVAVAAGDLAAYEFAVLAISGSNLHLDNRVRVFNLSAAADAETIAEFSARHEPGPALTRIAFNGASAGDYEVLLSRAMFGFKTIELTKLDGGSAKVFRADVRDKGLKCQPFLVKIDKTHKIDEEVANYREAVENHVAFPNRPPMLESRCVAGTQHQAMTSWFVSNATRFDEFIFKAGPSRAVFSLFQGPLKLWRSMTRPEDAQIAELYRDAGRLFKADDIRLNSLHSSLSQIKPVHSPVEIYNALLAIPRSNVEFCYAHGDLHTRNIFISDFAHDAIIIDFFAANKPSSVCRDPATLEVSVAFLFDANHAQLTDPILRELYAPKILDRGHIENDQDPRIEAILAIRGEARKRCTSFEYDISIAIMLMGEAARHKNAFAYELAESLLGGVGVI